LPPDPPPADPEGFHHRLLGREAPGEPLGGGRRSTPPAQLRRREDAEEKRLAPASHRPPDPVHLDDVDAEPPDHARRGLTRRALRLINQQHRNVVTDRIPAAALRPDAPV